jgi:DNA invertase Pin-like site-specific DNA recombinase
MSSDGQAGSIANQRAAIAAYARRHRIEVVSEYSDPGKSGLGIKGRPGLQRLLADVTSKDVEYHVILVYDVSRWGRFQDVDESAHYEFLCRNAGIDVVYCAEEFDNDGSAIAAIVKTMKRAMAAEYSRALSVKVFEAQTRLARSGFKQGGPAGYGLRRASVGPDGEIRRVLVAGDRKGAPADHVIFVWGPSHEVAIVRQIYDWYVSGEKGDTAIAAELNARGITSESGRTWTPPVVVSILTNEKYIGTVVYNRKSYKLQGVVCDNPRQAWIRKPKAFPALIDSAVFHRAQEIRRERAERYTRQELLDILRRIYSEHGKISTKLIDEYPDGPHHNAFLNRFQTLSNAYRLAGVPATQRADRYLDSLRKTETIRNDAMAKVKECVAAAGGTFDPLPSKNTFVLNGAAHTRLLVVRARRNREDRPYRWSFPLREVAGIHFIIAIQLEPSNSAVRGLYLLPVDVVRYPTLVMREERPDEFARCRYCSIDALFGT